MPENPRIVTRFAPSPTGALHVGGARTALFNWAFARHQGGAFILRIEDTDVARSTVESTRGILRDLAWLGLDWDQGPDPTAEDPYHAQRGDRGPYFQSQRADLYRKHLATLQKAGRVYDDQGALRFKMPAGPLTVHDLVLGDVTIEPGQPQLEDFIVFKSEAGGGGPTFHFANVVDDYEMGVTHVIRGQEHLNNTIKHLALFEALGLTPPAYGHIPLIFNPDGTKMSKRDKAKAARAAAKQAIDDGKDRVALVNEAFAYHEEVKLLVEPVRNLPRETFDAFLDKENDEIAVAEAYARVLGVTLPEIDVDDFRWSGYLPEAMVNYLALLGWNPGGDVEDFGDDPLAFIKERFTLDRVQKGQAKFDRAKLLEFNRRVIAGMSDEAFKQAIWTQPVTGDLLLNALSGEDDPRLDLLAKATKERSRTLRDPVEQNRYFFTDDFAYDDKAVQKNLAKNDGEGFTVLAALRDRLAALEPWSGTAAHEAIKALAEERGLGMGKVAQPLRVAVTGGTVSPPIDVTLDILGRDQTIARIERCLSVCRAGA